LIDHLRTAILVLLAAVIAGGLWMITRRRLAAWAHQTKGRPWFGAMGFILVPATWQGWLVALAILLVSFALGLLGASGALGPGHHFGGG
jgi:amino acid transporter